MEGVALTHYGCVGDGTGSYCGVMASGQTVHDGAAACGYAWELGQRFVILGDPSGRTYTCLDRGLGPWLWVDVWHYNAAAEGAAWRANFGQHVMVELP